MRALPLLSVLCSLLPAAGLICDPDTDCYYVPARLAGERAPALLVLHCNGALPADLDSFRFIADSLGWVLASCHRTRNHRDITLNDADVVRTAGKLRARYPVDAGRVYLFGFSGQGVQALAGLFLHPDIFRGAVAVCAHEGAHGLAVAEELAGRPVYLVTRQTDWNRAANERMAAEFRTWGMPCRLVVTPGKHDAGPRRELLPAVGWLDSLAAVPRK